MSSLPRSENDLHNVGRSGDNDSADEGDDRSLRKSLLHGDTGRTFHGRHISNQMLIKKVASVNN